MRAGYWVVFFASSADPTNAPRRRRIGLQFGNPAIDRAPRDTRRLLDYIGPSKAVGARLSRHEQSPPSFVENRQHIRVSLSDGLDYVEGANHPRILTRPIKAVNPQIVAGPSFPNPSPFRFTYFLKRTKFWTWRPTAPTGSSILYSVRRETPI